MSTRAELVRPFSQRNITLGVKIPTDKEKKFEREQFAAIKRDKNLITNDEILELKRERQNLIQERNLLKTKIARFADLAKRPNQPSTTNPRSRAPSRNTIIANSLQKQIDSLTQMIAQKRTETQQIMVSDRAVQIKELQEEALMLYSEVIRLQDEKKSVDNQYKNATEQLHQIKTHYSESVINDQHKTIKNLEKEISLQQQRNDMIRHKITLLKQEQKDDSFVSAADKMQRQIQNMKDKIKAEKEAIRRLDDETQKLRANHTMELKRLQAVK